LYHHFTTTDISCHFVDQTELKQKIKHLMLAHAFLPGIQLLAEVQKMGNEKIGEKHGKRKQKNACGQTQQKVSLVLLPGSGIPSEFVLNYFLTAESLRPNIRKAEIRSSTASDLEAINLSIEINDAFHCGPGTWKFNK